MSTAKRPELPELRPTPGGDRLYKVLGTLMRPVYATIGKVRFEGIENLPTNGSYIVVANHTTELDPVTIGYAPFIKGALPRFLAKDSLFHAPVLGYIMRKLAHIPVVRGSADARKSLDTARGVLAAGGAVVIFPEGTTTTEENNWPIPARTGAARLALSTGVPVIPMAHWGDQEILGYEYYTDEDGKQKYHRKVSLFPRKTVRVKIGKPMDVRTLVADPSPEAKHTRAELREVTESMMAEVTRLLEELRGEKAPQGVWNASTRRYEPAVEADTPEPKAGE